MAIDPRLYFDVSIDELGEVIRFVVAPVGEPLLPAQPVDPRITAALHTRAAYLRGVVG